MFYYVELPVLGQLGKKAILDKSTHPPSVAVWDCVLDTLPKTLIFSIFPSTIIEKELSSKLSNFKCERLTPHEGTFSILDHTSGISRDGSFLNLRWCEIQGKPYEDDLAIDRRGRLIVSEAAKSIILSFPHEGVEFIAENAPPSDEEIETALWKKAAAAAKEIRNARSG